MIWWTESFLAILPLFIILIALLLFFFLYTLLLTWIFGSILKDLTKLVWITAAWFINFRYSILRIFLNRFIYFLLNVILAWSFVESSPLCTHFVIARWLFSNAEIFCIVILVYFILTIFLFLVLYMIVVFRLYIWYWILLLLSSIYDIFWILTYFWTISILIINFFIWIFFLVLTTIFLLNNIDYTD